MRYTPVSCDQRETMLRAVGVSDAGELFGDIPSAVRLDRPLDLAERFANQDRVARRGQLDEYDFAELVLREVGDSDNRDVALDAHPLVLLVILQLARTHSRVSLHEVGTAPAAPFSLTVTWT